MFRANTLTIKLCLLLFINRRSSSDTIIAIKTVADGKSGGPKFVITLDNSCLYPEGGGQPSDRGTVNGKAFLDVQKAVGSG